VKYVIVERYICWYSKNLLFVRLDSKRSLPDIVICLTDKHTFSLTKLNIRDRNYITILLNSRLRTSTTDQLELDFSLISLSET
jgi:hypothetical protein